ncbi:phosphoglycerate mutase [Intrasporangium oryzae NRRL B-24470]|uniref:Phosphoglycerate mutase n=1 Tax=Intrasporangium oryzae NRRL B-24470 TaxID=1386089 RepID=W9G3R1_9MICO|nr:histidine phosphatase family protein [Intrasporangium oryzae]EWT00781.1 phosphoglycerate mutase [Intrasporangium oryzae NRRL B-24470]
MSLEYRPRRIILVRHGESEGNVDDTVYERIPDHRVGLTPRGYEQARRTGEALRGILAGESVDVYASPYLRARETLEALALPVAPGDVRVEPRLREQDWANFQDPADIAEQRAARDRYGHFFYRFKDGESGSDVYDRVSTFLESMFRNFDSPAAPRNVVIVTHGLTMRLFCMRWFHWSVEYFESLDNPDNAEPVVLLRQPDHRYRLERPFTQWNPDVVPSERERSSWL